MARCLTVYLIKYQKKQKEDRKKISKDRDKTSRTLVRKFDEILNITAEDLTREYSPTDVMQLCLRTKLRVDMTRYNCVYDAKSLLERRGRRVSNALLIKVVGRIVAPYTTDEIAKCNHVLQCELKKENNFRLDRWHLASSRLPLLSRSSTPILECLPLAQVTPVKTQEESNEDVELFPLSSDSERDSSSSESFVEPEMTNVENIAAPDIAQTDFQANLEATGTYLNISDNLEWVEEALQVNGDNEFLSLNETFCFNAEMQGSKSTGVFSCNSNLMENDATTNEEAITEWFKVARQQLEHIELF